MRIGVVGAGAIGGTIAALLDKAGYEVEVTARGEQLKAIRETGITLVGEWGNHTAYPQCNSMLQATPDLAFVCTKAQDASSALELNKVRLAGTAVVVVQNGLEGLASARRILSSSSCIGALALFAANYVSSGHVTVTAAGPMYLGDGTTEPTAAVKEATEVLASAMPARAASNFIGCQWTKLLINEVNAMPAITGLSVQETIADARLRRIITAAMREMVRVGRGAQIRFGSVQGLTDFRLRLFEHAGLTAGGLLPRLMAARMGSTPNLGSTLQSLKRSQKTEIDFLNGAVVTAATASGTTAPINESLVACVHEVEQDGRFLSVDEVILRVQISS